MKFIAAATDIREGSLHRFRVEGMQLFLTQVKGTYYAVENLCTHAMVTFGPATLVGLHLTCAWHGFRFNVDSGICDAWPGLEPLHRYTVIEQDGNLYLGDRRE